MSTLSDRGSYQSSELWKIFGKVCLSVSVHVVYTAFNRNRTSLLVHRKIFQIHRTISFNSDSEITMKY